MTLPAQVYIANPAGAATPIVADPASAPFTAPPVKVTLTVPVQQLCPPGWPAAPDETGVAAPSLWYPRPIASGATITVYACVALALLAANAAVLA